jgi:C-terminal processing protease CtpA/Prc
MISTPLRLKGGDIIMGINDKSYSLDNIYDMIKVKAGKKMTELLLK